MIVQNREEEYENCIGWYRTEKSRRTVKNGIVEQSTGVVELYRIP